MIIEKSTILSVLICIAGVLAEVIFHGPLSDSTMGIILSVVIAAIVLINSYLFIDGLLAGIGTARAMELEQQKAHQEKIYEMLDERMTEQIRFEKAIYVTVKALNEAQAQLHGQELELAPEVIETINANTMKAAKLIAKYTGKESQITRDILKEIGNQLGDIRADQKEQLSDRLFRVESALQPVFSQSTSQKLSRGAEKGTSSNIDVSMEEDIPRDESTTGKELAAIDESTAIDESAVIEESTPTMEEIAAKGGTALDMLLSASKQTGAESKVIAQSEEMEEPEAETAPEAVEEPVALEGPEAETAPETVEEPVALEEPEAETAPEAIPVEEPNKIMSPDDIAALLASIGDGDSTEETSEAAEEPTVEAEEPTAEVEEPAAEVEPEIKEEPNKPMSQEEIAALMSSMSATMEEESAQEATEESELESESQSEITPEESEENEIDDPNKQMSPDDIAALFAAMEKND